MLLMEIENLKKAYGDKELFNINYISVNSGDKIGIVGDNGVGKTTFLDIIAGETCPDSGSVTVNGEVGYIKQILHRSEYSSSGGEQEWSEIRQVFTNKPHVLLADEPTSNLSISHVNTLIDMIKNFNGAVIIVSHEKSLLEAVCNKIIEIKNGEVVEFRGNYSVYEQETSKLAMAQDRKYEKYKKEEARLAKSIAEVKQRAENIKSSRKGMGNSEARLHRMEARQKAGRVAREASAIKMRLNQLEEVKKPAKVQRTIIDAQSGGKIYSRYIVECNDLCKSFGSKVLFNNAAFKLKTGGKIALIGENGTGKTTLVKMILNNREDGIKVAQNAKIAYFAQDLSVLDYKKSVLENVKESSRMNETEIRNILARLLFFGDDVHKKAELLSGGERMKAAFAKLFCTDANFLILDEPSNFLDIKTAQALGEMIEDYCGTILLISHSRDLINYADSILIIENKCIFHYDGNYDEYQAETKEKKQNITHADKKLQLETQIARVLGRLSYAKTDSEKATLDQEFQRLIKEKRELNL